MIETVRWKRTKSLVFFGRNGTGLCTGIEIFHYDGVVSLTPFTSKDQVRPLRNHRASLRNSRD